MKRLTITISDKNKCNHSAFAVKTKWGKEIYIEVMQTKSGNLTLKDIYGKSYDKCSMSDWFNVYDYYSIYWDTANKQMMIETIVNELRKMLYY